MKRSSFLLLLNIIHYYCEGNYSGNKEQIIYRLHVILYCSLIIFQIAHATAGAYPEQHVREGEFVGVQKTYGEYTYFI